MTQRRIEILPDIQLTNEDGVPLVGARSTLSFEQFLRLVFQNPVWNTDWQWGLAQRSIRAAFALAKASSETWFPLAEDDWMKFAAAVKEPRIVRLTVNGPELVPGFGYDAWMASQILPMQLNVINATVIGA